MAVKTAVTSGFPLPYDESFHVGLIQLYSTHWSPFLASQPTGADGFGAVASDPSYLYHYLMSFPFRLISLLVDSPTQQIIALRLLNVGLAAATLLLFWKLARRAGVGPVVSNIAVVAIAFTPVFFQLSSQVNYDNLLLPITLLSVLLAWDVAKAVKRGSVPVTHVAWLAALLLLGSLVKYAFLPVMGMIGLYVIGVYVAQKLKSSVVWEIHWKQAGTIAAVLLVIVSSGLWAQRYGINIVRYHTPHPQCDAVLSIQQCSSYSPWHRNYLLHQVHAGQPSQGLQLATFAEGWIRAMYYKTYSTVKITPTAIVYVPIEPVRIAAKIIAVVAAVYALFSLRRLRVSNMPWLLLGLITAGYTATLFAQNFSDFHNLGEWIAVQGRYLLPVLPFIYLAIARTYSLLIYDLRLAHIQELAAGAIAVVLLVRRRTLRLIAQQKKLVHVAMHGLRHAIHFRTYP